MIARPRLLVFLTALSCLMFELVLSRLADFHLGASNSYLALPITFLGLAMGSMHVHFDPTVVDRFNVSRAVAALAAFSFVSLMTAFVAFGQLLPPVSEMSMADNKGYYAIKTIIFIVVMVPPFYVFGRILTVAYTQNRDRIGEIYSADFFGAALACAVTPILFHFTNLPVVGITLLVLTFLPIVLFRDAAARFSKGVVIGGLLGVAVVGQGLLTWSDNNLDYSRYRDGFSVREVRHGWNEFSRVSLLKLKDLKNNASFYKIEHDNSRSNVHVWAYDENKVGRAPSGITALEAGFIVGRKTDKVLAMFAGAGAEMIVLNQYAGGKAHITGVELNPLVKELAIESDELEGHKLREFHALPHIDLQSDEGRHFLSTHEDKYDLIFVGSNAATGVLTGHSRKYLDTEEAFALYLDRLNEGGVIVFDHQPIHRRLTTFFSLFKKRGMGDFADSTIIIKGKRGNDVLMVSPSGFSKEEVEKILAAAAPATDRVLHAPGGQGRGRYYEPHLRGDRQEELPSLVDDRPFLIGLDLDKYTVIPDPQHTRHYEGYLNWAKVTTLLVLCVIAILFLLIALTRKKTRPPAPILAYLLVTGFCFMLVEIAFIAKLELFLQEPIVSMATVLSIFLLTSGIGSAISKSIEKRVNIVVLIVAVAAIVTVTGLTMDWMNVNLLALPTVVKLVVASVTMAPTGIALGLFYPYAVSCLLHNEQEQSVPITYGISTLASVVGATYAMTMMIDVGFSALLRQATLGYGFLTLVVVIYTYAMRGRHLSIGS